MKIVKLITSHGTDSYSGKGGHYYSLVKIAKELSKEHTVNVFSFGGNPSPVISDKKNRLNTSHIYIRNISELFNFHQRENLIEIITNADLIHCYDTESLIYGGRLSRKFKKPILLTKCGGENPTSFFPFVNDIIVFSKENENYFKSKKKFNQTNTYVVPNRVDRFESDSIRICELKNKINSREELKILLIARFVEKYFHAHMQILNLSKRLRREGINCKSILVGHAINVEVVNKVKDEAEENDYIITDEKLCHNARQIIPISDIVVGHGRSIMEAAQFGKILMVPSENDVLPIMVEEKNFKAFLNYNMTARGVKVKSDINNLIKSIQNITEAEKFSKDLYEKYFSLNEINIKYKNIYEKANRKMRLIDLQLLKINKIKKLVW